MFHLRQLLIPDFLTPKAKIHPGQFLKEASKSAYCTGLKVKKKKKLGLQLPVYTLEAAFSVELLPLQCYNLDSRSAVFIALEMVNL